MQAVLVDMTAPLKPLQAVDGLIWRNTAWPNNIILSFWVPICLWVEKRLEFGPIKIVLGDRPPLVAGIAAKPGQDPWYEYERPGLRVLQQTTRMCTAPKLTWLHIQCKLI